VASRAWNVRVLAASLALVSLGVFILSVVSLAARIRDYNQSPERQRFAFMPVGDRSFTFAGRPVGLSDDDRGDQSVVLVRYGERELRLTAPVKPLPPELPGLARHQDWLRVLRFAERGSGSSEEFQKSLNEGHDRLVVVVRRPRVAADPRTGEVPKGDWVFDFNELLPDGSIRSHTLREPKTKGDKNPKADELKPNTWEMDAAMSLMPGSPPDSLNFGRPTASFKKDALTVAGWTMPAAVVSILALVASLAVMAAPRRTRLQKAA
jgi:hypothetical protein